MTIFAFNFKGIGRKKDGFIDETNQPSPYPWAGPPRSSFLVLVLIDIFSKVIHFRLRASAVNPVVFEPATLRKVVW